MQKEKKIDKVTSTLLDQLQLGFKPRKWKKNLVCSGTWHTATTTTIKTTKLSKIKLKKTKNLIIQVIKSKIS